MVGTKRDRIWLWVKTLGNLKFQLVVIHDYFLVKIAFDPSLGSDL